MPTAEPTADAARIAELEQPGVGPDKQEFCFGHRILAVLGAPSRPDGLDDAGLVAVDE